MYSVEKIEIIRLLSREEIIEMALNFGEERVNRFIQLYRLTHQRLLCLRKNLRNIQM